MHYSPFLPGVGFGGLGLLIPASDGPLLLAKILLQVSGLFFLTVAIFFLAANVVGAVLPSKRTSEEKARNDISDDLTSVGEVVA